MQEITAVLTAFLVLAVLVIFIVVVKGSGERKDYAVVQKKLYGFRRPFFLTAIGFGVFISVITLIDLPFATPSAQIGTPQVVKVTGVQWGWDMSSDELLVGQPVEFHVTSDDVNHNFAIYTSSLRMLAQTQAMPGYVNILRHTFDEPGTYKILCLEYCGLAHHDMISEITVVASRSSDEPATQPDLASETQESSSAETPEGQTEEDQDVESVESPVQPKQLPKDYRASLRGFLPEAVELLKEMARNEESPDPRLEAILAAIELGLKLEEDGGTIDAEWKNLSQSLSDHGYSRQDIMDMLRFLETEGRKSLKEWIVRIRDSEKLEDVIR